MNTAVLLAAVLVLGLLLLASVARRAELRRMARTVAARERAVRQGSDQAQLQHPVVDLTRCLGCGTCITACPEEGVLELLHGQAVVVDGARCVGHGRCAQECPVGAITVTLTDLAQRRDIPVVSDEWEAVGSPGLFLAGEVTAHALIRTAVQHGAAVAAAVQRRIAALPAADHTLDLCIVGAGPAGLACALAAKQLGLRFVLLEQEATLGGTVARYPRRKLVLTEPVALPLHGRMRAEYTKEELIALWQQLAAQHALPLRTGQVLEGVARDADGYVVRTRDQSHRARCVCLALGRRGVPRRLGVPGEELAKVSYALLDAASYAGRKVLVVGGGDSAVEAALALAEPPAAAVTLSYRRESLFRIRPRNAERLDAAVAHGHIDLRLGSEVRAIAADAVTLQTPAGAVTLPNDDVFVMAGGTTPVQLLEQCGVSFDPALRPVAEPLGEQGTGLGRALAYGFGLALLVLAFAFWHRDYYQLPALERPTHDKHALLRPGLGLGLWLGIAATALILVNLLYLLRRSQWLGFRLGSLSAWMTSHVATGIGAFLLAALHGGLLPRETPGGHAFWGLLLLLVTGAVGRYFYAYVPRATNGRELELAEAKARLLQLPEDLSPGQRQFGQHVRQELLQLIEARQWRGSFLGRVLALLGVELGARRRFQALAAAGRAAGIGADLVQATLLQARQAYRTALSVAHFEDLRAVLATWRWLHRWVAVLVVVLIVLHVLHALSFGGLLEKSP